MTMALQPRSYLFSRPAPDFEVSKYDRKKNVQKPRTSAPKEVKKEMSVTTITSTSPPRPTSSASIDIPVRPKNDVFQDVRRAAQVKKQSRDRKPSSERSLRRPRPPPRHDTISPSVATLLAITSIPRQKSDNYFQYRNGSAQKLTVDAILQHGSLEEKDSMSFGKSPMDVLLSPPDFDDDITESEAGQESVMSTRTLSSDSIPSLDGDSISDASPSFGSLSTPPRSRRSLPARRMQSISSQAGPMADEHPLSSPENEIDELDFRVFDHSPDTQVYLSPPTTPDLVSSRRKSAFKSNLTASLKALRSAAKSISSLTAPMITPDDFLTRSIITIDPRVPFTDERMPPRLEDTPTPALRRYLNPTTNAPIEAHISSSFAQTSTPMQCTASIQMQTYKVSRSKKGTSPSVISRRTQASSEEVIAAVAVGPVARQRDMRENSDFIRIAVMEMAMRKKGKLDDQKPGRARWALPPRQPPTKPYEISANGIPVRWIPVTH